MPLAPKFPFGINKRDILIRDVAEDITINAKIIINIHELAIMKVIIY